MRIKIDLKTDGEPNEKSVTTTDDQGNPIMAERLTFDWKAGQIPKLRLTMSCIKPQAFQMKLEGDALIDMKEDDLRRLAAAHGYDLTPSSGPDLSELE